MIVLSALLLPIFLKLVALQQLPPVPCPNLFQYSSYGNGIIGLITLPRVAQGTTKLDVQFSQREAGPSNNFGKLTVFDDPNTTVQNIQNGYPVRYRVDFPLPNAPAKLSKIAVNGAIICSGSLYPPPSTVIDLENTIDTTINTPHSVQPVSQTQPGSLLQPIFNPYDNTVTYELKPEWHYPAAGSPIFTQTDHKPPNYNPPSIMTIIYPQTQQPQPAPPQQRPQFDQQQPTWYSPNVTTSLVPQENQPPPAQQPRPQPTVAPQPRQTDAPLAKPHPTQQITTAPRVATSTCGLEGSRVSPFIFGGTALIRGQFPWLVAIYRKHAMGLSFICGGSLVSTTTIVTAGHCFRQNGNLQAHNVLTYLGRYDLDNCCEDGAEAREVRKLLMHPDYNSTLIVDADIAILHLVESVSFTQYIQPICLWTEPDDTKLIAGQTATVAGWGATEEAPTVVSPIPKRVNTAIVSENECLRKSEIYREFGYGRTFCAGNNDGTGPCLGDSGGALMLNRNGYWMLRGIVSLGGKIRESCNLQEYVIYCDVAKHMSWVRSNIVG